MHCLINGGFACVPAALLGLVFSLLGEAQTLSSSVKSMTFMMSRHGSYSQDVNTSRWAEVHAEANELN